MADSGNGIITNDSTADGLADTLRNVEWDIAKLQSKANENTVAILGACVGLLLQLFPRKLTPEDSEIDNLQEVLEEYQPYFHGLPGCSEEILNQVLDGHALVLGERPGQYSFEIDQVLLGDEFPLDEKARCFSYREDDLFGHELAKSYVQEFANVLFKRIAGAFENEQQIKELAEDLYHENIFMDALAILLVIEPCQVDPRKFEVWKNKIQAGKAAYDIECEEEGYEISDFNKKFYAHFYKACDLAAAKFRS